jgi:hypothetical protein
VTNDFVDEFFSLLCNSILPKPNTLPRSHYEAKKLVENLGLRYTMIHVCENGCVLFCNQLNDIEVCPVCGQSRHVDGHNKVPRKILKHFPLIPRLKRMFWTPDLLELMRWHHANRSHNGLVKHALDSKAQTHIDFTWPNFAKDPQNLKLGLALDGVNPFSNQSTNWSTWLIFILNYNIPPWLTIKKFFLMLVLLIVGKESMKSNNIDVYLTSSVEELQESWTSVSTWDIFQPNGRR